MLPQVAAHLDVWGLAFTPFPRGLATGMAHHPQLSLPLAGLSLTSGTGPFRSSGQRRASASRSPGNSLSPVGPLTRTVPVAVRWPVDVSGHIGDKERVNDARTGCAGQP